MPPSLATTVPRAGAAAAVRIGNESVAVQWVDGETYRCTLWINGCFAAEMGSHANARHVERRLTQVRRQLRLGPDDTNVDVVAVRQILRSPLVQDASGSWREPGQELRHRLRPSLLAMTPLQHITPIGRVAMHFSTRLALPRPLPGLKAEVLDAAHREGSVQMEFQGWPDVLASRGLGIDQGLRPLECTITGSSVEIGVTGQMPLALFANIVEHIGPYVHDALSEAQDRTLRHLLGGAASRLRLFGKLRAGQMSMPVVIEFNEIEWRPRIGAGIPDQALRERADAPTQ